jgi:hypothetical protein
MYTPFLFWRCRLQRSGMEWRYVFCTTEDKGFEAVLVGINGCMVEIIRDLVLPDGSVINYCCSPKIDAWLSVLFSAWTRIVAG